MTDTQDHLESEKATIDGQCEVVLHMSEGGRHWLSFEILGTAKDCLPGGHEFELGFIDSDTNEVFSFYTTQGTIYLEADNMFTLVGSTTSFLVDVKELLIAHELDVAFTCQFELTYSVAISEPTHPYGNLVPQPAAMIRFKTDDMHVPDKAGVSTYTVKFYCPRRNASPNISFTVCGQKDFGDPPIADYLVGLSPGTLPSLCPCAAGICRGEYFENEIIWS